MSPPSTDAERALFLAIGATRPNAAAKALGAGGSIHCAIPESGRGSRDHRDYPGARPIAAAALGHPLDFKRWPDLIETLLKAGADPNERAVFERFTGEPVLWTPLHGAIRKFSYDPQAAMRVAKALVAFGADPNAPLRKPAGAPYVGMGSTPLMFACHCCAWEMALWLLSLPGLDAKALDAQAQGPFHWAAQGGAAPGHEPVFNRLVALGVPLDEPDATGLTPLMHEIKDFGHKLETRSRLDWFLSHGANPTRPAPTGSLSLAAWAKRDYPFALDVGPKLESAAQRWELDQIALEIQTDPGARGPRRLAL